MNRVGFAQKVLYTKKIYLRLDELLSCRMSDSKSFWLRPDSGKSAEVRPIVSSSLRKLESERCCCGSANRFSIRIWKCSTIFAMVLSSKTSVLHFMIPLRPSFVSHIDNNKSTFAVRFSTWYRLNESPGSSHLSISTYPMMNIT